MENKKVIWGKNINMGTNFGHIGDRYEGVQQRVFTEVDFKSLLREIDKFKLQYSDKINDAHISLGIPGDKESNIYASQIYTALKENGFKVEEFSLTTIGFTDRHFSVSNAPDGTILIQVFQAPNV